MAIAIYPLAGYILAKKQPFGLHIKSYKGKETLEQCLAALPLKPFPSQSRASPEGQGRCGASPLPGFKGRTKHEKRMAKTDPLEGLYRRGTGHPRYPRPDDTCRRCSGNQPMKGGNLSNCYRIVGHKSVARTGEPFQRLAEYTPGVPPIPAT